MLPPHANVRYAKKQASQFEFGSQWLRVRLATLDMLDNELRAQASGCIRVSALPS